MFDFIKRKFREAIIDPISDSVRENRNNWQKRLLNMLHQAFSTYSSPLQEQ